MTDKTDDPLAAPRAFHVATDRPPLLDWRDYGGQTEVVVVTVYGRRDDNFGAKQAVIPWSWFMEDSKAVIDAVVRQGKTTNLRTQAEVDYDVLYSHLGKRE